MNAKPKTILFGSVELDGHRLLRERLSSADVRVLAADSSSEFLDLARKDHPDVVVLDDDLESLGGELLIRLVRQPCPEARVILIQAPGSHPDQAKLRHLGPVCTLVSPVSDDELAKVVSLALQNPRGLPSPRPPVVLCVDDDPLFLKSLARILRRRDVDVLCYDNPDEAREAIPIHNPVMAFIDVLMPGMSGLDLVSELREEYGSRLPMVLLSAKSSDEEIGQGMLAGAKHYVTKPCDPDRILQVADDLLGFRPVPRESIRKPAQ